MVFLCFWGGVFLCFWPPPPPPAPPHVCAGFFWRGLVFAMSQAKPGILALDYSPLPSHRPILKKIPTSPIACKIQKQRSISDSVRARVPVRVCEASRQVPRTRRRALSELTRGVAGGTRSHSASRRGGVAAGAGRQRPVAQGSWSLQQHATGLHHLDGTSVSWPRPNAATPHVRTQIDAA